MHDIFRKKNVAQILHDAEAIDREHGSLKKNLTVKDLTAFGIAAIIGAGIFSTIGNASYSGGPAVIFLFIFTAIACTFSAFAYAEFASMIPVAGSAYTYSYVAFGELVAWIIGWDLLMEYAIGNIAVAISWSDYFTSLLETIGFKMPDYLTMDFLSAWRGYENVSAQLQNGMSFNAIPEVLRSSYLAWQNAPQIFGLHMVFDLPALVITFFITWLVYTGIKESKRASNIMVLIKLAIILVVIAVGAMYVDTKHWSPFAPNGISGVLKGVSAVFFAYIGFDAISTTAEECNNPQRDLPRGMFYSIIICTVLYVAIALVLTGMVKYNELNVGDPLAYAFQKVGLNFISGVIAVSAVIAMASVLLVFQLGQPRIWMSMSRDGLLPKIFSRIHPKYRTPSFSTIVTGFVVAVPALFMNLTEVTDLTSIGTLFAFVLVCGGVIQLQAANPEIERKFKTPYVNSKYIVPALFILCLAALVTFNRESVNDFVYGRHVKSVDEILPALTDGEVHLMFSECTKIRQYDPSRFHSDVQFIKSMDESEFNVAAHAVQVSSEKIYHSGFDVWKHNIPLWLFCVLSAVISLECFRKSHSLIPVMGLLSCLYLMSELGITNWMRFLLWLIIGLVIYFTYGRFNSKLKNN
ncbi:MAG: amino acid permease [Bacteroidota bacterium]|nr:amino acid permease [Bacteroidota bacterium]